MTVKIELSTSLSDSIDLLTSIEDSELEVSFENDENIELESELSIVTGLEGVGDYEQLINKPKIEGHTLIGNSTLPEINVHEMTAAQAASLFN